MWRGTHRAEFLGVPATGRQITAKGMVIDRLVAGKMVDSARTEFPLQSRGVWIWVSTCKWLIAKSNRETDEENRNAATDQ